MKPIISVKKTIRPISARFIEELMGQGKAVFTLAEACSAYGRDKHDAGKFLSDLVKRDVLLRIKSGIYLIVQIGQENIQLSNWPIIARELASPNDYFLSHYSAMRLHGMTSHPLYDVYINITKRHRTKKINNITYHFIYSKPENFWGGSIHWVNKQEKILISDLERTILDGLERPELCGGIKDIARGIWVKQSENNWERLILYAAKFHTRASVKRLGFILETLKLGAQYLVFFAEIIASSNDYIFLDPNGTKEGRRLSRWHVRINMNIEELKASVWE